MKLKVYMLERTQIDFNCGYIDFAITGDTILYRMYFSNRNKIEKIVDFNYYGKPGECIRGKARKAIITAVNGMIENNLEKAVAILA